MNGATNTELLTCWCPYVELSAGSWKCWKYAAHLTMRYSLGVHHAQIHTKNDSSPPLLTLQLYDWSKEALFG